MPIGQARGASRNQLSADWDYGWIGGVEELPLDHEFLCTPRHYIPPAKGSICVSPWLASLGSSTYGALRALGWGLCGLHSHWRKAWGSKHGACGPGRLGLGPGGSMDWPKGIPQGQPATGPLNFHAGSLQGQPDC